MKPLSRLVPKLHLGTHWFVKFYFATPEDYLVT